MYFESHAHYDDEDFDSDREQLLGSFKENGIDFVVNVGANMASSKASVELADKYSFVYATVGVHPHDVAHMTAQDLISLKEMCQHKKVCAIGEIGLDYYYDLSPRDLQVKWFAAQLNLAKEVNKPVVIHSRDATDETYQIILASGIKKAVVHCFSSSTDYAKKYVDMNLYIGIGGVITFKNSRKLVEVVENIPLTSILIETDCPYLSPEPNRGKRNSSLNLKYVVEKIAAIKNISPEEVAEVTSKNAKELYGII